MRESNPRIGLKDHRSTTKLIEHGNGGFEPTTFCMQNKRSTS
jgi:hypothetical protein